MRGVPFLFCKGILMKQCSQRIHNFGPPHFIIQVSCTQFQMRWGAYSHKPFICRHVRLSRKLIKSQFPSCQIVYLVLVPVWIRRKLWPGVKSKGTFIRWEVLKHGVSKNKSSDAVSGRQEGSICVSHNSSHNTVNASEAQVGKHRQNQVGSLSSGKSLRQEGKPGWPSISTCPSGSWASRNHPLSQGGKKQSDWWFLILFH